MSGAHPLQQYLKSMFVRANEENVSFGKGCKSTLHEKTHLQRNFRDLEFKEEEGIEKLEVKEGLHLRSE